MKRVFAIAAAAAWLGCGPSFAQTVLPGMGTTSPLGVPGTNSSAGPVGIPLGATGLMPGGLSPGPLGPTANTTPCVGVGSSVQAGSSTTFDGGGVSGTQMSSSTSSAATNGMSATSGSCGTSPSGGTASGTTGSTPGTLGGSATGSGTIPLGATELGSAGVSPMMTVPGPTISNTPCPTVGGSTITMPSNATAPDGSTVTITPGATSLFGC